MSFTIGCDRELICRRNGQFVSASNYFKSQSGFGYTFLKNLKHTLHTVPEDCTEVLKRTGFVD
jgi:hypothetical protein